MRTQTTPYGFILMVVFIILKTTGHIDWSWWGVTAPVWAPIVFAAIVIALGITIERWNKGLCRRER